MNVHSPMRRMTMVACGLLLGVTALAGCSSTSAPAEPIGDIRTITDAMGTEVDVPAEPKRVVALAETDIDATFALGVEPVGISTGRQQSEAAKYLGDRTDGVPIVGELQRPNLDKIIEVEPDLILLGTLSDQQLLTQLRKVAPTVVTNKNTEGWKTSLNRVADALDRKEEAKQVLTEYDARVEEIKGKLGKNSGASISIVRWNAQGPSYMMRDSFPSTVIQEIGLVRPPAQAAEPGFSPSKPLSLESLDDLDADWLFLGTLTADGKDALAEVENSPAFQQLNAVKDDRLVPVDGEIWTSRGGPIAADVLLDDVEKNMID